MPLDLTAQYHVYGNGGAGGPIDYTTVLATVTGTIWTSPTLAPGNSWAWAVRAVDPATGLEDQNVDQRAFLVLDSSGNNVTLLPAAPTGLTVRPWTSGSLLVEWHAVVSGRDPTAATLFKGASMWPGAPAVLTNQLEGGGGRYWCVRVSS